MKLQYAGDTGWEMPAALPDVDDAFEPPPSKELPSGEELPQGSWAWPEVAKYQILTYRFAASEPKHCADLTDYRGGTYAGIQDKMDCLNELGVDGSVLSPVVEQMPKGCHGHWTKNLKQVNSNYGTAAELREVTHTPSALG